MRVALCTSNPGKVRELRSIVAGSGIQLESVQIWLGQEETGRTYLDNARLKASAGIRLLRMPVLTEDAGIEIEALAGIPGPRSARFAGPGATDEANNAKLLRLLSGVSEERRGARYRAVAVLRLPDGTEVVGEGVLEGRIATIPRGEGGFGYDPLFIPSGKDRTVAELTADEKNVISHRGRALRQLVGNARREGLLER